MILIDVWLCSRLVPNYYGRLIIIDDLRLIIIDDLTHLQIFFKALLEIKKGKMLKVIQNVHNIMWQ